MTSSDLTIAYERLHAEGTTLAGGLTDLAQRATVYQHIYRASQGNHAFPLIAAHGALWAGGQFRFGLKISRCLAWQYAWSARARADKLRGLTTFFDALRNINRQVCVDTYVQFHLTRRYRRHPEIGQFVPSDLLGPLSQMHDACDRGQPLTGEQRRQVFEAHFLHEQKTIVGATLERAAAALDWPLVKRIALRPRVRFAYLPRGAALTFRDFSSKADRIQNGLRAFDIAERVGWRRVEQSLSDYGLLTPESQTEPEVYFSQLASAMLVS